VSWLECFLHRANQVGQHCVEVDGMASRAVHAATIASES
jgi:hypothetical protein